MEGREGRQEIEIFLRKVPRNYLEWRQHGAEGGGVHDRVTEADAGLAPWWSRQTEPRCHIRHVCLLSLCFCQSWEGKRSFKKKLRGRKKRGNNSGGQIKDRFEETLSISDLRRLVSDNTQYSYCHVLHHSTGILVTHSGPSVFSTKSLCPPESVQGFQCP